MVTYLELDSVIKVNGVSLDEMVRDEGIEEYHVQEERMKFL